MQVAQGPEPWSTLTSPRQRSPYDLCTANLQFFGHHLLTALPSCQVAPVPRPRFQFPHLLLGERWLILELIPGANHQEAR